MPDALAGDALDLEATAERYRSAWAARDPDRIAALHTAETVFHLHTGAGPIHGRGTVRDAFAGLLARFPGFTIDARRTLLGDRHWVLDWTLAADGGIRVDCLDVVTVAPDGLVARKDTYLDAAQFQAVVAEAS